MMIYKKTFLLFILLVLSICVFCQTKYFKYRCFLDVSRGYLLYGVHSQDSTALTAFGSADKSIKIFDFNDKGALKFILCDKKRNEFIQGEYINSKIIHNVISDSKKAVRRVTSSKQHPTNDEFYYKPYRNGKWVYYDVSGKIIKKEFYKKGEIVKE